MVRLKFGTCEYISCAANPTIEYSQTTRDSGHHDTSDSQYNCINEIISNGWINLY